MVESFVDRRTGGGARALFDELIRSPWPLMKTISPPVEVSETENEITVRAEIPGVDAKEIDVSVDRNILMIKGEKRKEEQEENKKYIKREFSYGSFYRRIPLPVTVREQDIKATYSKGVLQVVLPKTEVVMTRRIQVSLE
jgi:HSP20 family protein